MTSIKNVFKSPPVLHTKRLTLRRMERGDYSDMFDYARHEEITRYLLWNPHPDKEYTLRYLSFVQNKYRQGEFFDWAVVFSGHMIGTCGFTAIDELNLCGEIGYVISPRYQNYGIATEAVMRVIDFAFVNLGLNRLECRYMIGNDASRRVMEKAGMTYEGTLRKAMYVKGRFVDVGICSILREEYVK